MDTERGRIIVAVQTKNSSQKEKKLTASNHVVFRMSFENRIFQPLELMFEKNLGHYCTYFSLGVISIYARYKNIKFFV